MPCKLKEELNVTQSVLDRLIQDHIYEFLVYVLPCKFASDMRQQRKRKASSAADDPPCSSSQLSSGVPNGPIVLTTHSNNPPEDSLSPLRGLLNNNGKMPQGTSNFSRSNSSSLKALSQSVSTHSSAEFPFSKLPKIGRPPKANRPRSKSTTVSNDQQNKKLKTKNTARNRSVSEEVPLVPPGPVPTVPSPDVNSNFNNSNEASPNTLLAITQFQQPSQIRALLPLTPTKNPFENPNQISEKIRKQLNLL